MRTQILTKMDLPSYISHQGSYLGIFAILMVITVTYCAPQSSRSSLLSEVFEGEGGLCEDLIKIGYEGFECTPRKSCGDDGYITRSAIDGDLQVWADKSYDEYYDENQVLDLSDYECPNVRQYDYDYYSDEDEDEMICCRSPKFYGKG